MTPDQFDIITVLAGMFIALSIVSIVGAIVSRILTRTHRQASIISRRKLAKYHETVDRR